MNNSCKIVMYHYVRPLKASKYSKIKGLEFEKFQKQIKFFKSKFHFISASDILDTIYNKKTIPKNSIALTFDDGFKDHYQYVFPILKKLKIPGMFFPPAQPIKENNILDVHKIHFILASCKNISQLVNDLDELIVKYKKKYNLHSPQWYKSRFIVPDRFDSKNVVFVKSALQKGLPKEARNFFSDLLFQKYVTKNKIAFSKRLYLSKKEIKEMVEWGMYFGSNGFSHE